MERPNRLKDYRGKRFGLITVVSLSFKEGRYRYVHVVCDCNPEIVFRKRSGHVYHGKVKSCGCKRYGRHNKSKSAAYSSWVHMRQRCLNKNSDNYEDYGGRGIKICDRWLESFENFYEDMGDPPTDKHTLGRINNDGDYYFENCQWELPNQQNNNRRNTLHVTAFGETKPCSNWVQDNRCVVNYSTLSSRIRLGWDAELAITTPKQEEKSSLTAFGETKSYVEWAKDSRCVVDSELLGKRIREGWSPERAITQAVRKGKIYVEIFGELKTYSEWSRDHRCQVSLGTFHARIKAGWTLEESLTIPLRGK